MLLSELVPCHYHLQCCLKTRQGLIPLASCLSLLDSFSSLLPFLKDLLWIGHEVDGDPYLEWGFFNVMVLTCSKICIENSPQMVSLGKDTTAPKDIFERYRLPCSQADLD